MDDKFYNILLNIPFPSAIYEGTPPYAKIFTNKAYNKEKHKYNDVVDTSLRRMFSNSYKTYLDVYNYNDSLYYIHAKAEKLEDGNFMVNFSSLQTSLVKAIAKNEFYSFQYNPDTRELRKTYVSNITTTVKKNITYNYPESLRESDSIYKEDIEFYISRFNKFLNNNKEFDTRINIRRGKKYNYENNTISLSKIINESGKVTSIIGAADNTQMTIENKNKYNALINSIENNKNLDNKYSSSLILNISKNKLIKTFGHIETYNRFIGINTDRLYNLFIKTSALKVDQKIYKQDDILSEYLKGNSLLTCNISFTNKASIRDLSLRYETVRDINSGDIICFIFVKDITINNILQNITEYINKNIYEEVIYLDVNSEFYYLFNKKSKAIVFESSMGSSIFNKSFILDDKYLKEKKLINFFNVKELREKLKNKKPYTISSKIIDSEGIEKNFILTADYISADKIIILIMDNTDIMAIEKENERVLKIALKEAEVANLSKLTFLNNMSHDIRTPLTTVLNTTDLALHEIKDKESLSYFNDIKSSGNYLLNIINDVLQMSRLQSNKVSSVKKSNNLKIFVDSIIKIVKPLSDSKKLDLILDFDYEDNLSLKFDEIHTKQILINLLTNAIKYTDYGYVKWSSSITKENGITLFKNTIKDSGIGINKSNLEKIFESFVRESDSEHKKYGTGLGLAITKNLVNLLDGSINVQSTKNKGSSFSIKIPIEFSKPIKDVNKKNIDISKLRNKKVLIAEDNEINSKILTKILLKYNMICTVAKNGLEAVNIYNDSFDFVLMDIRMPIKNGLEAAKEIISTSNKDVIIIALSANAFEEDTKASLECGMKEHLTKPIQISNLIDVMLKYNN